MEEAHSTVSMSNHHVTDTIAEEEQEDTADLDKQGAGPNWADAAAAGQDWSQVNAALGPSGAAAGEGSEAGQNWNWPWLTGQLASGHGPMDPSALLDDESDGAFRRCTSNPQLRSMQQQCCLCILVKLKEMPSSWLCEVLLLC